MLRTRLLKTPHVVFAAYKVRRIIFSPHLGLWIKTDFASLDSSPLDPQLPVARPD